MQFCFKTFVLIIMNGFFFQYFWESVHFTAVLKNPFQWWISLFPAYNLSIRALMYRREKWIKSLHFNQSFFILLNIMHKCCTTLRSMYIVNEVVISNDFDSIKHAPYFFSLKRIKAKTLLHTLSSHRFQAENFASSLCLLLSLIKILYST